MQEGLAALGGLGRIFSENVALSGRVPQISVVSGVSAGGGCYSPGLTDFVLMVEGASMFLTGPGVVREAIGEDVSAAELGGARVHERNGVCDHVASDLPAAASFARELLGYLGPAGQPSIPGYPFAAGPLAGPTAGPLADPTPDPGALAEAAPDPGALAELAPDPGALVPHASRRTYDVRAVIRCLA